MTVTSNIAAALDAKPALWSPVLVGTVNDHDIRAANVAGEYHAHVHVDTDEVFIVLAGRLHLDLDDETISLGPFDVYTVVRGTRHRPRAENGTRIINIERHGTVPDGDLDANSDSAPH